MRPISGLEFNGNVAGPLARVISPPYDVIDEKQRKVLAARSPYNIVRLILPEAAAGMDKYAAAGALVRKWTSEGALVRTAPALYVIEQRFEVEGRELVRTAVLGEMRLSRWREAGVYPHEVTLPKPRADRLNLYRAARVQPGPVFSLFEDAGGAIASAVAEVKSAPPYREADGPEGAFDRVWKVSDAAARRLCDLFAKESFFIADGHHRYETALAYRDEVAGGKPLADDHPANFVLMAAVAFDDPGLVMLPTHRLLCGDGEASVTDALDALSRDYDVTRGATVDDLKRVTAAPGASLGIYAGARSALVEMKSNARESFAREAGDLMAGLNVYEALERVLPRFFRDVKAAIAEEAVRYTHDFAEALARVDSGACRAAVILSPIAVRQMAAVASAGRTMPPKSTYFYPKLPTGVVVKPLA